MTNLGGTGVSENTDFDDEVTELLDRQDRLNPLTLAAWQADPRAQAGDVVTPAERSTGNGGGAPGKVISGTGTANGGDKVQHGTLPLTWVLRRGGTFNAKEWGVTLNAKLASDGVATATDKTFTSTLAAWVAADIGKTIVVEGAGTAGGTHETTIESINSGQSIEMALAAVTTVASNAEYYYGTDDTLAAQFVLDTAGDILIRTATGTSDINFPRKGGNKVFFDAGGSIISSIEIPQMVNFRCAGITSTLFISTFDGQIIRNRVTLPGVGTFDKTGVKIGGFAIRGDRTKTNQVGLDTLRLFDANVEDITIGQCGKEGLIIRQAITCTFKRIVSLNNVGEGIVLDVGINSWADQTINDYPSNSNTLDNCHSVFNDKEGLLFRGRTNNNRVVGGSYETNYKSSGDNVGFNITDESLSFSENVLLDVAVEGAVQAHVFVNKATASSPFRMTGLRHLANGPTGTVDRAVIVAKGACHISEAFGQGESYKTIAGSNKPFRLVLAGAQATLVVENCRGSTITDSNFVEDENGNTTNVVAQRNFNRPIDGFNYSDTLPSDNPNVFDAYLEGTWTPVLTTDGTDFTSVEYDSLTDGTFTLTGDRCHFTGALRTDAVTVGAASGAVRIAGAPFIADGLGSIAVGTATAWNVNNPRGGYMLDGESSLELVYRTTANGGDVILQFSDVDTTANDNLIRFSGSYKIALVTVALVGSVIPSTDKTDIVTGGKTIVLTLTDDTWKVAGAGPIGSIADTQDIIDGLDSKQSELTGWNAEVRDKELITAVVRTSATVCSITLSAHAGYNITEQETITVTIPTSALTLSNAQTIVAPRRFTVDAV